MCLISWFNSIFKENLNKVFKTYVQMTLVSEYFFFSHSIFFFLKVSLKLHYSLIKYCSLGNTNQSTDILM